MVQEIKPGRNRFKKTFVKIMFFVFGRAIQTASRIDGIIRKEVAGWPEGFSVLYRVLPNGPQIALAKNRKGRLEYRGSNLSEEEADLIISLKNLESAFMVIAMQVGTYQAFAENRVSVKGNVPVAMSLTRCLDVVITYLAPQRTAETLIKRLPPIPKGRKIFNRFLIYLIGVPFGL